MDWATMALLKEWTGIIAVTAAGAWTVYLLLKKTRRNNHCF